MAVSIKNSVRRGAVALFLVLCSLTPASFAAPVITYNTTNLSGNIWSNQYTVSNPAPSDPITEFTIWFDRTQYDNLSLIATPATWDGIVIQSDNSIPADGFFDSLALGPGIGVDEILAGFTLQFSFLGTGTPGTQPFDILDAGFNVVFSDVTTQGRGTPGTIPEPGVAWLILASAMGLVVVRQKR